MLRNSIIGLAVFGVTAAIAGYVWTAFEFPFAIAVPAALGWYAVARHDFGARKAYLAALLGALTFTVVFMLAVFLALADGSAVSPSAWAAATVAAAVAGALGGLVLGGARGAVALAAFSAGGMALATAAMGIMRAIAPSAVDVEGEAQYLYFALAQGMVGAIVGAALGAGVAWLATHATGTRVEGAPPLTGGTAHGA